MRSRINSNLKKQTIHIFIGIIGIILFLIFFGTHLLIGISTILEKLSNSKDSNADSQVMSYIAPPVLNPIEDATNKNSIEISGYITSDNSTVQLYVNGKLHGKLKASTNNTFIFTNVKLDEGQNEIKARSLTSDSEKSDFSNSIEIEYLIKNPELEINSPSDGQIFKKDQGAIRISGKTDPSAKVTVNDFWAITDDNGDFYYLYSLKDGDNNLKITSTDKAGNKTTKEINIKAE
jgi:bacillopeptidase F